MVSRVRAHTNTNDVVGVSNFCSSDAMLAMVDVFVDLTHILCVRDVNKLHTKKSYRRQQKNKLVGWN